MKTWRSSSKGLPDPSGYALLKAMGPDAGDHDGSIWLPICVADEILEQRQRALRARAEEQRRRLDEAMSVSNERPSPPSTVVQIDAGFVQRFDHEAKGHWRSRRFPVIAGVELLRASERVTTLRDRDYQRRERDFIEKIKAKGPLRKVANPILSPTAWNGTVESLNRRYPHFREVTEHVARQVSLSTRTRAPLSLTPIHIWGEPGLGKSHYANALAVELQ